MNASARPYLILAIGVGISVGVPDATQAGDRITLDHAAIVVDSDQPSFVMYSVEGLAAYLQEGSGNPVPVGASESTAAAALILVGPEPARRVVGEALTANPPGEEGYILKTLRRDGRAIVVATGTDPRGTKAALMALMRAIRVDAKVPYVDGPLDLRGKPSFATRGMHFNGWPFNYPHSFRRWREEDWQRYLDILALQNVNLFYFWPFMEIIPLPLSQQDRAYLEECRRIIDYAQTKHGMQVWIMQSTNRVAKDRCGVEDPKARPYWRPTQEDLKPGDPKDYKAIMASREMLYRMLDNVDGVCNIDSDPGWCFDCPLEDYVKVLKGCRSLLDRYNIHGEQARLMSWMWCGWGMSEKRYFDLDHQEATVAALQQGLSGRWGLVPGQFSYLPICREHGLMERTILLPYGMIENEPSYPWTNVGMDAIRTAMERRFPLNPDLTGVIGNVQTPLLQLPHVYFFTSALWDLKSLETSEKDALLQLGGHLYPEHAGLIADGYLALKDADFASVASLADRLDELVRENKLGRLGVIGRKLFPDHRIVAQAIALQLRLHAAKERLMQKLDVSTSKAECAEMIEQCLDAYLAWEHAHGWHDFWGWSNIPLVPVSVDPRYPTMARRLARCLRDKATIDACLAEVGKALSATYDPSIVEQGCIAPLSSRLTAFLNNRASWATATASVVPKPGQYPPDAANDGSLTTQYWPGALVQDNTEWIQLTWDEPQTFQKVVVRFLQHPSMHGRTIHLQRETATGQWEDLATAEVPPDGNVPHALATFEFPSPVTLDKFRIVNLLDIYEIEVD